MGKRRALFVLIISTLQAFGQHPSCDSLNAEAKGQLNLGHFEEADSLAMEALHIAEMQGDSCNQVIASYWLASARQAVGSYKDAAPFFESAIQIAEDLGDTLLLSQALVHYGGMFISLSLYSEADERIRTAMTFLQGSDDSLELATCYVQFATLNYFEDQLDSAIFYYQKALAYGEALGDQRLVATCCQNIGLTAKEMGNYSLAEEFTKRGIQIALDQKDDYYLNECYKNLSYIYLRQGMTLEAIQAQQALFETLNTNKISLHDALLVEEAEIMKEVAQRQKQVERQLSDTNSKLQIFLWVSLVLGLTIVVLTSLILKRSRQDKIIYTMQSLDDHLKPLLDKGDPQLLFVHLYTLIGTKGVHLAKLMNKAPSRISHMKKEIQQILGVDDISDAAYVQRFNMVDIVQMISRLDWKKVVNSSLEDEES